MHKVKKRVQTTSLFDAHEERFTLLPHDGMPKVVSKYQQNLGAVEFKKGEGRKNPIFHITDKIAIGRTHNDQMGSMVQQNLTKNNKRVCLDKVYDYNLDNSTMIPNYREISFGKEDRWNNQFTFFQDPNTKDAFGQAEARESTCDLEKAFMAEMYLLKPLPHDQRDFSKSFKP